VIWKPILKILSTFLNAETKRSRFFGDCISPNTRNENFSRTKQMNTNKNGVPGSGGEPPG